MHAIQFNYFLVAFALRKMGKKLTGSGDISDGNSMNLLETSRMTFNRCCVLLNFDRALPLLSGCTRFCLQDAEGNIST
jgi:hypothetical protein